MRPVKLSERNTMFTEKMGTEYDLNIGLIRAGRHNFVIDTALGSGSVQPVIDMLRGDDKPVIVINTHSHWDHVWGNWVFADSLIISHVKCRELMEIHWDNALEEYKDVIDGEVRKCLPNLVFSDELYFPDDGVRVFFTPGHDADCVSVYDERDRVMYAGDNIGDTESEIVPFISTDLVTFRHTIEAYKRCSFDICVSGHNKPQGRDVLARMDNALEDSWRRQIEQYGMP